MRFRDEKESDLGNERSDMYDNEKKTYPFKPRSIPGVYQRNQQISFCNTTMKTRCGRIFLSLFSVPVFRVIWVYTIFAYFHTITSLYLLYIFSWRITSAAEILYFRHGYKRCRSVKNKITYLITKRLRRLTSLFLLS